MLCKPSDFYSNFSINGLVKSNTSLFARDCVGSNMGGGGGTGVAYSGGPKESRYHKGETFSWQLEPGRFAKSAEAEFMSLLKADVESQLTRCNACLTYGGDLMVPGFFFEYTAEGVRGRIELTGELARASLYSVTATINELSTSDMQHRISRNDLGPRPVGIYHLVAFLAGDSSALEFVEAGRKAMKDSLERVRQMLLADPLRKDVLIKSLEQAEIYVLERISAEFKQRWIESMGEELDAPAEYDMYDKVFFLNIAALRMYREAGVEFEILKTISADELPGILGPCLRGPCVSHP